jgi:hypothetical protein
VEPESGARCTSSAGLLRLLCLLARLDTVMGADHLTDAGSRSAVWRPHDGVCQNELRLPGVENAALAPS